MVTYQRHIDALKLALQHIPHARNGADRCDRCTLEEYLRQAEAEVATITSNPEQTAPQEVINLLKRGKTIAAIKAFRDANGLGLRDAKDAIFLLRSRLRLEPSRVVVQGVTLLKSEVADLLKGMAIPAQRSVRDRLGLRDGSEFDIISDALNKPLRDYM